MKEKSNTPKLLLLAFLLLAAAFAYALVPAGAAPVATADKILVVKSEHTMTLVKNSVPIKTYKISIGRNPVGAKTREGDHRTPEGNYVVDWRNPQSKFHLSLHVSYPNTHDSANAQVEHVQPGGDIMIHGLQNGLGWIGRFHRFVDWTDGCIAVTNSEMDQIWQAVPDRTPIEIRP
jgi:murein L,D-transpeptidase YafK